MDWQRKLSQRKIDAVCQISDRVDQGTVKVEEDGFYFSHVKGF
jgi:hypothetical protein